MNTEITLLKWPGEEDWMFAKNCALVTIGKHSGKAPDMEWKHRMLRAKHSPIRTLNFAFYLHNVPYYVSTHLVLQKVCGGHFQSFFERNELIKDWWDK